METILPELLQDEILSFLDAKFLIRVCLLVSKKWKDLVEHQVPTRLVFRMYSNGYAFPIQIDREFKFQNMELLSNSFPLKNIRRITVETISNGQLEVLTRFSQMEHLKVRSFLMTPEEVEENTSLMVTLFNRLKKLELKWMTCDWKATRVFNSKLLSIISTGCKQLTYLRLHSLDGECTKLMVESGLFEKLEGLTLDDYIFTNSDIEVLSSIGEGAKLKVLNLGNVNRNTEANVAHSLFTCASFCNLEKLSIKSVTNDYVKSIATSSVLWNLESLILTSFSFGDGISYDGIEALCQSRLRLYHLELSFSSLNDQAFTLMSQCGDFISCIKELVLNRIKASDGFEGMKMFMSCPYTSQLQQLIFSVENARGGDEIFKVVTENMINLERLEFDCKIGDVGVQHLSCAKLEKLRYLSLKRNYNITSVGWKFLASCSTLPSLKTLDIRDNKSQSDESSNIIKSNPVFSDLEIIRYTSERDLKQSEFMMSFSSSSLFGSTGKTEGFTFGFSK